VKNGQSKPIQVDTAGNIIDGNHRARAAAEMGEDVDAQVAPIAGANRVLDLPIIQR
jgi:ParB-like chromosome segregation protein Spo0J